MERRTVALLSFLLVLELLAARASSESQCGQLVNNLNTTYPGTVYAQMYAAQAFRVVLATQLFNVTVASTSSITRRCNEGLRSTLNFFLSQQA
jgi:hypothetical protein